MPAVSVRVEPERVADRVPPGRRRATVAESPSGSGVSARACVSIFSTATSVDGSLPTTVALIWSLPENETCTFCAPCDHVVVRDDVARLVDDEARAERLLGLLSPGGSRTGRPASCVTVVAVICTTPGASLHVDRLAASARRRGAAARRSSSAGAVICSTAGSPSRRASRMPPRRRARRPPPTSGDDEQLGGATDGAAAVHAAVITMTSFKSALAAD